MLIKDHHWEMIKDRFIPDEIKEINNVTLARSQKPMGIIIGEHLLTPVLRSKLYSALGMKREASQVKPGES
jgi:hypothetical protein